MNPKSKEFKTLQNKWYKKLEKSGFDDVEQDEEHLKFWSRHYFLSNLDEQKYKAKEEYYRLAGQFLYEHEFQNERERLIWYYHSEGISMRNIATIMTKLGYKAGKDSVNQSVQRLSQIMVTTCWTKQS